MQYRTRIIVSSLTALLSLGAQAQDSATRGKLLYDDTIDASGINSLTGTCDSCHSVQSRRGMIAGSRTNPGSPYANIEFDQAMARFQQAVSGNAGNMSQFAQLSPQDARDIGAYLSDTPKTLPSTGTTMTFAASAVGTPTAAQNVDLSNSVATTANLVVSGVALGGADAARFNLVTDSCSTQTLGAGASCRLSVRYTATGTSLATAQLTLTMRQGTSPSFTRVLPLSGSIASPPPPPTGGGGSGDSGGGALGIGWLAALALATAGLATHRARRG
jgi:cytochrome c553